jgi:hypothetical protein
MEFVANMNLRDVAFDPVSEDMLLRDWALPAKDATADRAGHHPHPTKQRTQNTALSKHAS